MTIERLRPECISCLIKGNLEKFPEGISDAAKLEYMQRVLKVVAEAPKTVSAPVIVRTVNEIQKELFGYEADYTDIRRHFNQVMLEREAGIRQKLEQSEDSLKLAIQYAMTGNYIDFGAMKNVDEEKLGELLEDARHNPVNDREYEALKQDLAKGKKLVYLTDNCGEIVLDKLLIQEIQRFNPQLEVTAIVRGAAVLNDAVLEDAQQTGLTEIVRVIGNGNNIAGTWLEELSEEAGQEVEAADVIIAKGQGNFETLRMCGKNIYYIFMCKCEMFATEFQVPRFSGILVNDSSYGLK